MPDYYTSDATQFPFSAILKGTGQNLPIPIRLLFAFRKSVGWHYPAVHARCAPENWPSVELADLPQSAREPLASGIAEMERYGFRFFAAVRSNTIGMQVTYTAILISEDRTTTCNIFALRSGLANLSRCVFGIGLRSDFVDGTIIATSRSSEPACGNIARHMLRPHQQLEMLAESTPTSKFIQRHKDRIASFSPEEFVRVPIERTEEYFIACGHRDFEDYLATGMFRKLSPREVARLEKIVFDFE